MITSVSDALKNEPQENGQAKIMTADLAQSVYQGDFRVPVNANMPRTGAFTNFMYGLIDTADTFFNDTPEQVRLLGGQSQVVIGGLKNDKELIKRGQMNLQTATRNLQYNQQQRDMLTPESAQESFGYTLGSGVTNYGTMVLGGYGAGAGVKALTGSAKLSGKVAGAASIGTMGVMEIGGEAQERAHKYTADTQDTSFENYAPEQGLKNIAAEAGYATISMIMEKYMGYGEQRRMFSLDLAKLRNPKLRATASLTKTGVKAGISEAGTEFAQSLANIGIDLADGTMDWEQVPDRLKQELSGWAAAAVIGGTAGVGAGIYNRSRGIKIIKEELRGAVPEEDLERTAAAVFDSAAQKVSDVVSVELELSSELQTKHGMVMDSMQRAIKQAADESGAFTDVSEEELAQYIGDTSKLFADQVLAEATQRNVPIEEVIKASDIVYENGEIRLKNKEEKSSVSQEKLYQRAFAGSRVDYDRPSLEAIGSGEGNQAHGWGLYYALDKDVAERYREYFERDNYFFDEDKLEVERQKQEKSGNFSKTELLEDLLIHHDESNLGNFSDEVVDWYKKEIRPNVLNKNYRKTQVHEVEIPENPYLLDEQKYIGEQSDIIKKNIKNTLMRLKGLAESGAYPDYKKALTALDYEYADIENRIDNPDFYENKTGYQIYDIIEQIMGSDREASLFLLENGIKGITYEGQQDGRAFVIFNPDDVEVIQKFYQEQSVEQAFSPTNRDKNTYINDLRAAERGEAGNDYNIRLGSLPVIYQKIGIENKPVKTKKTIILKDTISKHDVPMNVVENLPELYSNPLVIFKSLSTSTNPDSYVAVLDATDKNGRQMIAALSPSKKENGYHLITSFYGRNNIDNMIRKAFEEGKVKYIRDKKISLLAGHDAYLSQANNNILQKSDIVNSFMQQKPQPKGLYDANKGVIKIFESADFSTLPHELAHYWLDNMWRYVRSGNASEKYRQRWNIIANWLNVKQKQAFLTRGQQEKFARGYEQYLLNGNLPTPIIKGAFDDYDRWLKRVYGDMNRLNVRLSEDAVRFFQSMTTGVLPLPAIKPSRKPRSKMTRAEKLREKYGIKAQDEQEKRAAEFVKEQEKEHKIPENAESRTIITSNITDGEKGSSRVYSRETQRNIDTLQEIADIDLEYNKINLEEQARRAEDFVKNNLEEARKIVNGEKLAPDNILDTAIRIAYEQEMLRIGNNAEYLRALKLHSSLQTLRGQEIVAEKISTRDITNPTYWINKVIANRTQKAAAKIFHGWLEPVGGESPIESYKKMIKKETESITRKVLAEKTREGQQRVLNAELKRLRHEYNTGEQGELFQMPAEPLNVRNAKMYINEALNELFGATITPEENAQIIAKIDELDKSIANTLDETKNPSLETWQKISEMNNLIESLSPSPALQIATSIVGRGAMLASVKSPTLNIISNAENILSEAIIRRALSAVEGGATNSMVDKQVIKDYLQYANDVYKTSGYNVSTLQDMDATVVTLGERRITTQGEGKFREFARGVETGVFKYLMGYPDSISKDFVFSDTAALEATTIAMNEGLSGEALTNRATYLFKDATLVTPQTEEGQIIRDKAIMEANVATYTNDTAFSKFALGIRETLNKATGNLRLGDQLMPFVKTPANVIGLGIDYSIGAAYLIPNLPTVIRDVKAGKLSAKSRFAIKAAMRNGLGVVLAMLISYALDPDDYTPEYESLTPSERRLAMEKNAVFNSIRIGDKYISLDYFGPLALPLAAVLTARRREETTWFGYAKGVASQLRKIPGIQEFSEAADSIKAAATDTLDETLKNLTNSMIDFIRARTIPSIVNDVAKSLDDYERETSVFEMAKAQNSIPFLRENLPLKYGTTKPTPRETEFPLWTILFGARVKTANSNRVIYEIDRLFKKGQRPTITDVTWSGKLSSLNEADQQRVRKEFARRYYDGVYKLINTRKYRRLDDDDKKNAINSVRRKIINELKNKYLD